jgi:hypothetical protein
MMNPAWPERIDSGQAGQTIRSGRQTGIGEGQVAEGFSPGRETGEGVTRRGAVPVSLRSTDCD